MGSLREFGIPTPMVRSDLRRDMVGVPKISGPQERERERCGVPRGNVFTTGDPQSLVGNPVPRDESELRPSARISRKRERSQLCV
jgi:hypothetical protein